MLTVLVLAPAGLAAQTAMPKTKPQVVVGKLPPVQDILDHMERVYIHCTSYRDTGTVTTVFHRTPRFTEAKSFSTRFVRPKLFRFEYRSNGFGLMPERCVIWSDGHQVRSWWTVQPRVEVSSSLAMPLAGATGVSNGAAHTIPRLLLPQEVEGRRIDELQNLSLRGIEKAQDRDCFKITGTYQYIFRRKAVNRQYTLWIDAQTYLLLRIYERTKSPDMDTEKTTVYKPQRDVVIDPKEFVFVPPAP